MTFWSGDKRGFCGGYARRGVCRHGPMCAEGRQEAPADSGWLEVRRRRRLSMIAHRWSSGSTGVALRDVNNGNVVKTMNW